MATAPKFADRRTVYARQWADMEIDPGRTAQIDKAARQLIASKARYQIVASRVNVPWFFIACTHWREASGSFAGVLHNGERIIGKGVKTKLVPAGRGPFATWEAAAIDALTIPPHDMRKVNIDGIERFAYECEKYNGFGYYFKGVPSAYLWSFSSIYKGGKYVADGKWSSSAMDIQIGVMPLLRRMMVLDATIGFGAPLPDLEPVIPPAPPPKPPASPVGPAVGGILVVLAAALAWFWENVVAALDWIWPFN